MSLVEEKRRALVRFSWCTLAPIALSRLFVVLQIAALFQLCPFVFNDVEHVGVSGQCNGSVLQLTSSGCV